MYTIYDVMLLIPVLLLASWWWRTSQQKTLAVEAARQYCAQRQLQFLDESLVFRRYRREGFKPHRRLCRLYEFDYSPDGRSRESGEIVLHGYRVLRVVLHGGALEITQY
jgi:hypothetical protein